MRPVLHISACCESDKGLVRSYNEDACLVNNEDRYWLVADGMGGEAAGELASALFRDTVAELFAITPRQWLSDESLSELIVECFHSAHDRIRLHVQEEPSHRGMGCTAELLVFQNDRIFLGHVGDSRTYLFRGTEIARLTSDHSLVQEQADLGLISVEQARTHALKHYVLRAVGGSERLQVDLIGSDVRPGDIFLLCTDGLTSMVTDDQIAEILDHDLELSIKATMLIDQANHHGGADNVTVALVEFAAPAGAAGR